MALRPVDTETFYREVDEELRRDRMLRLWQRYRTLAIAGVVLFLVALAAGIWWKGHREEVRGERGQQLLSSFDDIGVGKVSDAKKKLETLAKEGSPGYRAAALFTQADMAVESKDLKGAAALFRQAAADASLPQPYRDLATVRLTAVEFDALKPQEVIDRLRPLAVKGNPYFGSAGEMVALSYMKLNKSQEAARLFADIAKDKQAPDSIRGRAADMAGSLGVDVGQGAAQEGK